jgi:hypothetical protein
MSDKQPSFYMVSGEMSAPEVVRCWILRSLRDGRGYDLLLVRIDPPYKYVPGFMPGQIEEVVLAWGNGVGYWLPIKVWPMGVQVLAVKGEELSSNDIIDPSHLTVIDKAGLLQTEQDARSWVD